MRPSKYYEKLKIPYCRYCAIFYELLYLFD